MSAAALSVSQMEKLKSLIGDVTDASMVRYRLIGMDSQDITCDVETFKKIYNNSLYWLQDAKVEYEVYYLYTLEDVLKKLPINDIFWTTDTHKDGHTVYNIHFMRDEDETDIQICWGDNMLEPAYNMLVWFLESKYNRLL